MHMDILHQYYRSILTIIIMSRLRQYYDCVKMNCHGLYAWKPYSFQCL
jgi:hypothetical protein